MAIEIDGKVYRNLPAQVKKNKEDIAELKAQPGFDPTEIQAAIAALQSGKLEKITTTSTFKSLYGIAENGSQERIYIRQNANISGTIPMYTSWGTITSGEPVNQKDCSNKQYTDSHVGTKLYKHDLRTPASAVIKFSIITTSPDAITLVDTKYVYGGEIISAIIYVNNQVFTLSINTQFNQGAFPADTKKIDSAYYISNGTITSASFAQTLSDTVTEL